MMIGEIYEQIKDIVIDMQADGCTTPYFRGQSDCRWELVPSIARDPLRLVTYDRLERETYTKFITKGSHLLSGYRTTWDDLFLMQHHGIPTRLLDWTESFAVALYFSMPYGKDAASQSPSSGSLFVLNPNRLNREFASGRNSVVSLNFDYPHGYERYFLSGGANVQFPRVLAIGGLNTSSRIRAQNGVFTIHGNPIEPLEFLCPDAVRKIVIPATAFDRINMFLWLAGINVFSIFQDLDSLGEYIRYNELY